MDKIKYYRGNINLLCAGEKLQYTEEQIEEIIKCSNDYEYFIYKYVKIKTKNGLELPDIRKYQKRIFNNIHDNKRLLIMAGRQCGKSSSIAMYIVWYILFHAHKTVGIVANKEKVAKLMLANVKTIFTNLPLFLKPGVEQWGMTEIKLDNNCVVVVSACSADALTGYTLNFLVVDEVSKIPKNKANDFFDSVLPTVEADDNAKIVCCSTPKGLNIWYKMWKEAEQGSSGYITCKVEWHEPPGRDEEWKKTKIDEKGVEYFNQEFACEFLGSSSTLIDGNKIKSMPIMKPVLEQYDGRFKVYYPPEKDGIYVLICDVSEGLEQDYSTIQVIQLNCNPYKQVATYRNNTIKPFAFPLVIEKVANYYNTALVIIETNSCGREVVDNLHYDLDYENIFYEDDFGLKTTKKVKSSGCSNLSHLVETDRLLLCDYETINEISRFVYDGKTYKAQDYDDHDDLVMPLVLFSYVAMDKVLADLWFEENNFINNILEESKLELDEFFILIDYDD